MILKPFRFKQFIIYHQQSTLKVGTDAVLLGAWADVGSADTILEIGSGCGIISLMLAQRSSARIEAVEIDTASANESKRNVEISKWKDKIVIHNISFQTFAEEKNSMYYLIVSNPPYFNNSLKSSDANKNLAKHNDNLSYDELAYGISKLLNLKGKACLILSLSESIKLKEIAVKYGLHCNKEMEVIPKTGLKANRVLMQFSKQKQSLQVNQITVLNENKNYSKDFIELTKDFYLNL